MNKLNKTHFLVLGMLSISAMSGYEIKQTMKSSTSHFWTESDGQLYPALASLSKQKLIVRIKPNNPTGRDTKIYAITEQGKKQLQSWLEQNPETHLVRNEFMLKLFFGANISTQQNIEQLKTQKHQAQQMHKELIKLTMKLCNEHKTSPHLPYWLITLDYGMQMSEAKLTWCERSIKQLKNKRK